MASAGKRIKFSILTSPSGWGGMEVHTLELARTLQSKGYDVTILEVGSNLFTKERFAYGETISVKRIEVGRPFRNPGLFGSFFILRHLKGSVCIFPKGGFEDGSWQFDLLARLLSVRYITIEHLESQPLLPKTSKRHFGGMLPGLGIWWYKTKLWNYFRSKLPHSVVTVSNAVEKRLVECHHFSPLKITTVQNGIDSDKFRPNRIYREAQRKIWGIPTDALVFGAIGRLHPVKGFGLALDLFREIISYARHRDVWFVLGGDGPEHDVLMSLAETPELKDKVRLIGFTDRSWEIYPAFDLYLMPSRNEGLPLSLLEAMACGCCPIAMGVGGIPEVISNSDHGWLVSPDDRQGYLTAMKEAADLDTGRLKEMGKKARQNVVANFEAERQFRLLTDLIEKECESLSARLFDSNSTSTIQDRL